MAKKTENGLWLLGLGMAVLFMLNKSKPKTAKLGTLANCRSDYCWTCLREFGRGCVCTHSGNIGCTNTSQDWS